MSLVTRCRSSKSGTRLVQVSLVTGCFSSESGIRLVQVSLVFIAVHVSLVIRCR